MNNRLETGGWRLEVQIGKDRSRISLNGGEERVIFASAQMVESVSTPSLQPPAPSQVP
jgi:hypothetical protein